MRTQLTSSIALTIALAASAACGGRTAAATQPTPAAFDPNQSDPQALGVVDKMIAELGGAVAWADVKQIQWEKRHSLDGQLNAWFRHAWDLWNGRHRFESADMNSVAANKADPREKIRFNVAMYDLFNRAKGAVFPGGNMQQQAVRADRDEFIGVAYQTWQADSYELTMYHKLKDPGVLLKYAGEVKDVQGYCNPACHEIKISFAPEVGTDVYYLDINTQTNMPEIMQKEVSTGRIAFALLDWTTVGGLKFPQKLQNLGVQGEVVELGQIRIGSPDDALYIPPVF